MEAELAEGPVRSQIIGLGWLPRGSREVAAVARTTDKAVGFVAAGTRRWETYLTPDGGFSMKVENSFFWEMNRACNSIPWTRNESSVQFNSVSFN